MEESASQAAWRIEHTIVTDQPIGADAVLEDHGQWMYTSLEDVCLYIDILEWFAIHSRK